jgi:hypothetical protein
MWYKYKGYRTSLLRHQRFTTNTSKEKHISGYVLRKIILKFIWSTRNSGRVHTAGFTYTEHTHKRNE